MKEKIKRELLILLLSSEGYGIEFWQIARLPYPVSSLLDTLEEMKREGLVSLENTRVRLVNPYEIRKSFPKPLTFSMDRVIQTYVGYRSRIHFADEELDQLPITPESVRRKLSLLEKRKDLYEKSIICIGDDDLFSIACALTGLPATVDVVDASKDVIDYLNEVAGEMPIPLNTYKHNLLESTPDFMKDKYHVVITAPPDTLEGILLFVARGVEMLKKGGAIYFSMSEVLLDRPMWNRIQSILVNHNLVFTDIVRACEEYIATGNEFAWRGAEKLPSWINKPATRPWFTASVLRAEVINKTPIPLPQIHPEELITKIL